MQVLSGSRRSSVVSLLECGNGFHGVEFEDGGDGVGAGGVGDPVDQGFGEVGGGYAESGKGPRRGDPVAAGEVARRSASRWPTWSGRVRAARRGRSPRPQQPGRRRVGGAGRGDRRGGRHRRPGDLRLGTTRSPTWPALLVSRQSVRGSAWPEPPGAVDRVRWCGAWQPACQRRAVLLRSILSRCRPSCERIRSGAACRSCVASTTTIFDQLRVERGGGHGQGDVGAPGVVAADLILVGATRGRTVPSERAGRRPSVAVA